MIALSYHADPPRRPAIATHALVFFILILAVYAFGNAAYFALYFHDPQIFLLFWSEIAVLMALPFLLPALLFWLTLLRLCSRPHRQLRPHSLTLTLVAAILAGVLLATLAGPGNLVHNRPLTDIVSWSLLLLLGPAIAFLLTTTPTPSPP